MVRVTEDAGGIELGLLGGGLEHRVERFGTQDDGTGSDSTYQKTGDHPSILTGNRDQALLAS